MDKLVSILAPHGRIDFVFKTSLLLLAIGLMNWARDILELGADNRGYLDNLREAIFVGWPFVVLYLVMLGHLARLQRKLLHLATTDMLTGLPNRRAFLDHIADDKQIRHDGIFLMIDLDHFKRINDSYGHYVGDMCLRETANFILDLTQDTMICARLGGEEFGIYMPDLLAESGVLADQLAKGLEIDVPDAGTISLTMSIGVTRGNAGCGVGLIMARADRALYFAKAQGRARVATWTPQIDAVPFPQAI